jgi:myo-inositol-hexaphosphate 3-phosphohydrolase
MPIDLPKPIAKYFAADKGGAEAVVQCFTENAVVKDEGNTYAGQDEIRRWKTETSAKYTYTVDLIAAEHSGGTTVVTGHLVGDFPGGVVDLRYFFELKGEKIASLEIIP